MTELDFYGEIRRYLSDLKIEGPPGMKAEFYCDLQPGMISYGGHFIPVDNEPVPIDIRKKGKHANSVFADKVRSFHRQSTNGGLNKWNRAFFSIDAHGDITGQFTWDEAWEQADKDASHAEPGSVRQKWYWEE